jgi:hypothetical protein
MSDQKKPKIDLKARLGKKTVTAPVGGPAIPPPVGIPKPPIMSAVPAIHGVVAAPAAAPQVDPSNPYAAIEAHHAPKVEPKAIKIEMSEEVVQAQKKGRSRVLMLAGITAFIGGIIGFAFGSGSERGKAADTAVAGAADLVKEIDAANTTANKLSDVLSAAAEKLAKGEYPEAQVSELGGINIPFEGANLADKGIGRFPRALLTMLVTYANRSQEANDQKERIARILSNARTGLQELLAAKTNPKVRWSVFVQPSPQGPVANMQPLPASFPAGQPWPAEFKIPNGQQTLTLKRYTSGDPSASEPDKFQLIPVAPGTESSVCPSTDIIRLRNELGDMQRILKGDQTPGNEKAGLIELGTQVTDALKKIGGPGA